MNKTKFFIFLVSLVVNLSFGQESKHGVQLQYLTSFSIGPSDAVEANSNLNGFEFEYNYGITDFFALTASINFSNFSESLEENPDYDFDKVFSGSQTLFGLGIRTQSNFGGYLQFLIGNKNTTYSGFSNLSALPDFPRPAVQEEKTLIYGTKFGVFYNFHLSDAFSIGADVYYQYQMENDNQYAKSFNNIIGGGLFVRYKFISRAEYFFLD